MHASPLNSRREFLKAFTAITLVGTAPRRTDSAQTAALPKKSATKRIFVADFSDETNTFHPLKSTAFSYSQVEADFSLPRWKEAGIVAVPGVAASPKSGGTIDEMAGREAMDKVLESLRAAAPVDGVFLRLHGAMYAENIGPAESVLVGEVRHLIGPNVP